MELLLFILINTEFFRYLVTYHCIGHIILRNFPFIKSMLPHVYILRFSHVISPFWNAPSFPCNFLYVFIFLKIYFIVGGCINSSATKSTCWFCKRHSSVPNTNMVGHNHPWLQFQGIGSHHLTSMDAKHACGWHTCVYVKTLRHLKYMFLKDTFYF